MEEEKAIGGALMGIVGIVVVMGFLDYITKMNIPSTTPEVPEEGEYTPPGSWACVYGFVTDATTGMPIEGVKVTLDGVTRYTAWEGQYEFRDCVVGKTYYMTFSMSGYKSVSLKVKTIADLNEVSVALLYA